MKTVLSFLIKIWELMKKPSTTFAALCLVVFQAFKLGERTEQHKRHKDQLIQVQNRLKINNEIKSKTYDDIVRSLRKWVRK